MNDSEDDDGPETVLTTSYGHTRVPHRAERRVTVTVTEVLQ